MSHGDVAALALDWFQTQLLFSSLILGKSLEVPGLLFLLLHDKVVNHPQVGLLNHRFLVPLPPGLIQQAGVGPENLHF